MFPGTWVGMNTLCMCCPNHENTSSGRAVTTVLTEACGNASASTRRSFVCEAPCRPPGPPACPWVPPGGPGSRPCTFPWEPVPPKSAVEAYPISRTSTLAAVVLNNRFPICPCSPENRQDPLPRLHFQPLTHRGGSGRWKQIPFPGGPWSLFPASGTWVDTGV